MLTKSSYCTTVRLLKWVIMIRYLPHKAHTLTCSIRRQNTMHRSRNRVVSSLPFASIVKLKASLSTLNMEEEAFDILTTYFFLYDVYGSQTLPSQTENDTR